MLPAGVSLSDGLTEDEAVTLALARNPDFQADLADLLFAGASLQEAGQFRNPVLTLLFPWGPKQLEATVKWPFDALWLRPRRVAAARLDADAVVERLVARGLSLAADARIAYADAMAARQRAAAVSEAARVRERIGEIAEARLKAGDVSAFEIGATRADAALAGEERARALADAQAAEDRLRALLGLGDEPFALSPAPVATAACAELPALLRDGARRLNREAGSPESSFDAVLNATVEVRSAVLYGSLIVAFVFLPVFLLEGLPGSFFRPLALSYVLAVMGSLLVALTLTPALSLLLLPRVREHGDPPVVRWLKARYRILLPKFLDRPRRVKWGLAAAFTLTFVAALFLGEEFLPQFKE